jgi:hydrogenase maturation protein HypF
MRDDAEQHGERIRVRGVVQGVGFRPTVWRLARAFGVRGSVSNDGDGVVIVACGLPATLDRFAAAIVSEAPPLARVAALDRAPLAAEEWPRASGFDIVASARGEVHTAVAADAATCPACLAEIEDPRARRYRYPFTNCTHCGPRLSIVEAVPYDRATTTLRDFALCPECAAEYTDPGDRRFHAQPIACPVCGPHAWLEDADGREVGAAAWKALGVAEAIDAVDAAGRLIARGAIVAVKGLGGFQLGCDAGDAAAVARLRAGKRREAKPFALMARDLDVVRRHARVDADEAALLQSPAAPIVLLDALDGGQDIAAQVAPGVNTLGFMLPNTPLHHLLLQRLARPIVLTSGNLSDEPQCIANDEARARLGGASGLADYFLMNDRGIARRVDDSVARVSCGAPRVLRRARGYAPAPIAVADGFAAAPPVLALGGELKNSFCLLRDGQAIVSQHIGDLADAACHADYLRCLASYRQLFDFAPQIVAVDLHPEYLSRKLGLELADNEGVVLAEVQHHHAHIAACLAEHGVAIDAPPVLGVVLDGLGYGDDATLWGGEFLLADYRDYRRLARFKPVAMPGGAQAIFEPWRNTYAHLMACLGRQALADTFGDLELSAYLAGKPCALLDAMLSRGLNSPLASSCGRLFDAVAAAAGLSRERAAYEGQAAVEFEALVDRATLSCEEASAYRFDCAFGVAGEGAGLPQLDPAPMWRALLRDLAKATPLPRIAARFHLGLAQAIVRLVERLCSEHDRGAGMAPMRVALSGGVFQNRVLLEEVVARLESGGRRVLCPRQVPANDGGLALGQAVVAAARRLSRSTIN